VAWSPDEQHAVSASYDGTVRIWHVDSGACLHVLHGRDAGPLNAVWSDGGRRVHSCDGKGGLRIWAVDRPTGS
jgi:WD40 repeat protein